MPVRKRARHQRHALVEPRVRVRPAQARRQRRASVELELLPRAADHAQVRTGLTDLRDQVVRRAPAASPLPVLRSDCRVALPERLVVIDDRAVHDFVACRRRSRRRPRARWSRRSRRCHTRASSTDTRSAYAPLRFEYCRHELDGAGTRPIDAVLLVVLLVIGGLLRRALCDLRHRRRVAVAAQVALDARELLRVLRRRRGLAEELALLLDARDAVRRRGVMRQPGGLLRLVDLRELC